MSSFHAPFYALELRAYATVIDLAAHLHNNAADDSRIHLFRYYNALARQLADHVGKACPLLFPQRTGHYDFGIDPTSGIIQQTAIVTRDGC